MANYEFDMGVIGGGAAGPTVTSGAAQSGAKTLLVQKGLKLFLTSRGKPAGLIPLAVPFKWLPFYDQHRNV